MGGRLALSEEMDVSGDFTRLLREFARGSDLFRDASWSSSLEDAHPRKEAFEGAMPNPTALVLGVLKVPAQGSIQGLP